MVKLPRRFFSYQFVQLAVSATIQIWTARETVHHYSFRFWTLTGFGINCGCLFFAVFIFFKNSFAVVIQLNNKAVSRFDGGNFYVFLFHVAAFQVIHIRMPKTCEATK